jgi:hypothetical protein
MCMIKRQKERGGIPGAFPPSTRAYIVATLYAAQATCVVELELAPKAVSKAF